MSKSGVNYGAVMAHRGNSYRKHFKPSTETVDAMEEKLQEYLSVTCPGENVFIKVTYPDGRRSVARLWEWNMEDMKHGVSAKTWLAEKLANDFEYSKKEVTDYFKSLKVIKVTWSEVDEELEIV